MRDVARSRDFHADVLGGEVVPAENPAIVKAADSWIIMNPGAGPTADKPGVTLTAPEPGPGVGSRNIRVTDIAECYARAKDKGARFLTEPLDRKAELRCSTQDPDGRLIEVGQATGMLRGVYADPPAGSGTG